MLIERVLQTNFTPEKGDCFCACISMITGFPLQEIPNFCLDHNRYWWRDTTEWLFARGWVGMLINRAAWEADDVCTWGLLESNIPVIVSAQSPRFDKPVLHAVVLQGGKQYDPHPSGTGVPEPYADIILLIPAGKLGWN